jgi:serine/threonine-protein kinase
MRGDLVDRDDLMARLRRERQILADLHHEHIARLLDGGVDRKGRPYLVMEYVEGERIDQYCDAHGLDIEARIHLFLQVGEAVAAAHRRAVIHRDLKPSNILVTSQESGGDGALYLEPRAKLLDFGIAKLLNQSEADQHEPITRKGTVLLTPEYAAPEQIEDEGITTATDVYQLGVLLYELLTGTRPFGRTAEKKRGPARRRAIEKAILSSEPERPSTAVTRMNPDAAQSTWGSDKATLMRRLRGDLDAICLKAMRKEPEARYRSAEAMMDDIRRYAENQPVTARQGATLYRTRKFMRRHRKAFVSAVILASVLVGGGTLYINNKMEAFAQREPQNWFISGLLLKMQQSYDRAEMLYNQSTNLYQDLLPSDDQSEVRDNPVLFVGDFPPHAYQQLMVQYELASLLSKQNRYAEAEQLIRDILSAGPGQLGKPTFLEFRNALASVLSKRANYADAEQILLESISLRQKWFGAKVPSQDKGLRWDMRDLADILSRQGKLKEAEQIHWDILHSYQPGPEAAFSMRRLALVLSKQGKYQDAESWLMLNLDAIRTRYGHMSSRTRLYLSHFIELYEAWEKPAKAARWRAELEAIKGNREVRARPSSENSNDRATGGYARLKFPAL